uniref:hypothetical protein n=1 Tax=Halomonas sp. TaxID=1486246 RepID=UPI002621B670|nr:hypothetical protein [Halomonas sp.]
MNQHDPLAHAQFDKDAPPSPPERLDYYMPATPPLGLIHALEYWWWTYRRRRHFRRSVQPLLEYDDALLADMGFRHGDLVWALRLPLKEDALSALSTCRLQGMETSDSEEEGCSGEYSRGESISEACGIKECHAMPSAK